MSKINSRNLAAIETKIASLTPFETNGALRATAGPVESLGRLPYSVWDRIPGEWEAIYVVWSYDTPIMWVCFDEENPSEAIWIYPEVTYSRTTSRHQHTARIAVASAWGEMAIIRY